MNRLIDRLLLVVLFVVFAVFSVGALRDLHEQRQQTANQSKLLQTTLSGELEWSRISTLCVLDTSGAINQGKIPYTPQSVSDYVNACFAHNGPIYNAPTPK